MAQRSKTQSDEWRCSECQSTSSGRGYPVCQWCRKDIQITNEAMKRIVLGKPRPSARAKGEKNG